MRSLKMVETWRLIYWKVIFGHRNGLGWVRAFTGVPGGYRNPLLPLELALVFSLEEEWVMQQSRVSISLSFENQGINPIGDNTQVTEYVHKQSTTCTQRDKGVVITHKYRGSQQFSRVDYSTQIYWFDTRGAKEYSQVLAAELSIQPHLENFISAAKKLVGK